MTVARASFPLLVATAVGVAILARPCSATADEPATPPVGAGIAGPATLQEVARIQGFRWRAYGAFSPDSRILATCDADRQVHFWDLGTLQERAVYDAKSRFKLVDTDLCGFSPGGGTFVVYGYAPVPKGTAPRPEVALLDTTTGKERARFPGQDPVISPVGKHLAVRRGDSIVLLDIDTGAEVRTLAAGPPSKSWPPHRFAPDGSLLFTAGPAGQSRLWEVATGRERARIDGYCPAFATAAPVFATIVPGSGPPWEQRGDAPADPPGAGGPVVKVWDTATGNERASVRGFEAPGIHMAISPDGRSLLTSPWYTELTADGAYETPKPPPPVSRKIGHIETRLWDTATGREQARLPGRTRYTRDAFLSPDGKTVVFPRLIGLSQATELVLWDVGQRTIRMTLRCGDGIDTFRQSRDGSILVAVVSDNRSETGPLMLRFWDMATGKEWVSDVQSERFGIVASMYTTFSPDGTMVTVPFPRGGYVAPPGPPAELRLLKFSEQPLKRVMLGKPVDPP
jgi:WD40 repeat protein